MDWKKKKAVKISQKCLQPSVWAAVLQYYRASTARAAIHRSSLKIRTFFHSDKLHISSFPHIKPLKRQKTELLLSDRYNLKKKKKTWLWMYMSGFIKGLICKKFPMISGIVWFNFRVQSSSVDLLYQFNVPVSFCQFCCSVRLVLEPTAELSWVNNGLSIVLAEPKIVSDQIEYSILWFCLFDWLLLVFIADIFLY